MARAVWYVTGAVEVSFQPSVNTSVLLEDVLLLLEKVAIGSKDRLIVVLDEFQEVNKIESGLDRRLRAMMQHHTAINYIFLGSQESMMSELFEKRKSPFYHFGQLMRLSKIPYDDFNAFIVDRLPDLVDDKERIAAEILQFTSCHPYYTQQLASEVYEQVMLNGYSCDIVEIAVAEIVRLHDLDFERLWLSLNRTDRSTLRNLAKGLNPMVDRNFPTSTTYSSIKRLAQLGYVAKEASYIVEDPFFGRWIILLS